VGAAVDNLMIQFLEWVRSSPRTYADAMAAWRTSCPRLSIWEDALLGGLIEVEASAFRNTAAIRLTSKGDAVLADRPV
jgi:hypothetical protein